MSGYPTANTFIFFQSGPPSPLSVICAVLLFSKFTQLTAGATSTADGYEKEVLLSKKGDH